MMTTLRSLVSFVVELPLKVILIKSERGAARDDPDHRDNYEHNINLAALNFKRLSRLSTRVTGFIVLVNWHDNEQRSLSNRRNCICSDSSHELKIYEAPEQSTDDDDTKHRISKVSDKS